MEGPMEVEVAVSKIGKYATSTSGDTFEMVERPRGGMSFVLADGQRSGRSAKVISNMVCRKAISLLGEGVRDEAAAKAAHDYLYAHRGGKVSATLNIVSILQAKRRIILARNNPVPLWIVRGNDVQVYDAASEAVGQHEGIEPEMTSLDIADDGPPLRVVVATDGLVSAGRRHGERVDVPAEIASVFSGPAEHQGAAQLADRLLSAAMNCDRQKPLDDTSVLVLAVQPRRVRDDARRLRVNVPLGPRGR